MKTVQDAVREPQITAANHFRGSRDPLQQAFLHVVRLESRETRTRKLSAAEWQAEFKIFCERERR